MKSAKLKFLLLFGVLLTGFLNLSAQTLPQRPDPPRLVNDLAGLLSPDETLALEQKLVAYSDSTSTQIAVVVVRALDGFDISEFATEIGEKWGVGNKEKDNGVVVAIALDDRKLFIATGRGTEGSLPDAVCKRIIEQILKPAFREQAYYQGLDAATDEMIQRLQGEFTADESTGDDGDYVVYFIIAFLIIFLVILPILNKGNRYQQIGGRGYRSPPIWGGGFGGFSGGSRSSGGGGFGGFGGGSFGGGGAGGSW